MIHRTQTIDKVFKSAERAQMFVDDFNNTIASAGMFHVKHLNRARIIKDLHKHFSEHRYFSAKQVTLAHRLMMEMEVR